tara:strand:+ start:833 stop:1252 length:420 start_codon:yes stop_codon:yes gene_type:complete
MPKNLKGGSKHKKMKNKNSNDDEDSKIILKDSDDQDYGKVEKLLGNCRVSLLCNDKITRIGIIRGNMKKKQWVNLHNIVLYSKREYEDTKVDIIHVYSNDKVKQLKNQMNLMFSINENEEDADDICFSNNEDDFDLNDI